MKLILSLMTVISLAFAGNLTRANDIVTDNETKLQWQDDGSVIKDWTSALLYCKELELGGHTDWKLPTIAQLRTIVHPKNKMPTIDKTFQNTRPDFYWSSTSYTSDEHRAKAIHFSFGDETSDYKYDEYLVRCVREAE